MMKYIKLSLLLLIITSSSNTWSQIDRKVCVLNMTNYNGETGTSRKLSAIRVMRLAGVPYDTTSSLAIALQYPVIITGSRIQENAFNAAEILAIDNFVSTGGVLITSSVREPDLFSLCGISNSTSSNTLFEMKWDTLSAPIFDLIDDSLEVTISLGRPSSGTSFYTRQYDLTTGTPLAFYENQEPAVVQNNYGSGAVYTFGPDFRDVLYRNQANFDVQAHRTYSNGFEPTSDVIMIVLRNIVREHIPHTVYKHTAHNNAHSSIMLTHDVDSRTAMDTMHVFSEYQFQNGIKAHYNITTRYLSDQWMTNFYVGGYTQINKLQLDGHTLASHSVGHYPDFADINLFPMGVLGNTTGNYSPNYSGGSTANGSVLGEIEVSKNLLQDDFSVSIRSFRAGHLAYNDSLIRAMELTNYSYNSTYSANDVLSSFPYYAIRDRSFSADESTILEIPMTISDVYSSDPIDNSNYPEKVAIWNTVTQQYHDNFAPTTILIHPNRMYKLDAMIDYINGLPNRSEIIAFEEFGDFWRNRDSLEYITEIIGNDLVVTVQSLNFVEEQSFVIDWNGSLDTVLFKDEFNTPISFEFEQLSANKRLYFQKDIIANLSNEIDQTKINIYPNPNNGTFTIDASKLSGEKSILITDLTGKIIHSSIENSDLISVSISNKNTSPGIYIVVVQQGDKVYREKIVIGR